jgi:hypothetical protein
MSDSDDSSATRLELDYQGKKVCVDDDDEGLIETEPLVQDRVSDRGVLIPPPVITARCSVEDSGCIYYGQAPEAPAPSQFGDTQRLLVDSDEEDDSSSNDKENSTAAGTVSTVKASTASTAAKKKPSKDLSQAKRWPHKENLILQYPNIVIKMLQACEEARAPETMEMSKGMVGAKHWTFCSVATEAHWPVFFPQSRSLLDSRSR